MGCEVLLWVPNIIGYIRIALASLALAFFYQPTTCALLYGLSISLDCLDGYAARKLHQVSTFGAWFDVVVDNYSRGLLWCALYRWGYLVIFVEWMTFLSTHSRGGNWKIPEDHFPALVKMVMCKGFRSPMGIFAVGSLHVLPLWLYLHEMHVFTTTLSALAWLEYPGIVVLTAGRVVCSSVELFYVFNYIKHLLNADAKSQ